MRRSIVVAVLTLVLVVGGAGAALGSVSHAGHWKGRTSQGKVIRFHVTARNRIDTITVSMKIPFTNCSGNVTFTSHTTFRRPVAITRAKFRLHLGSNPRVLVTGHFSSAARAAGSMRGTFSDPVSGCRGAKTVSWKAHKVT